jgi:hypothetical protein
MNHDNLESGHNKINPNPMNNNMNQGQNEQIKIVLMVHQIISNLTVQILIKYMNILIIKI